jgi:outer membrane protein assembly complex protein YaeT
MRRFGLPAGLALLLAAAPALRAQETRCDPGDTEVRRLAFRGNVAFNDATLAAGIVTTPSSWARRSLRLFGTRRCLDRAQFPADVTRLRIWYRNHGFTDAVVDTVVTQLAPNRIAVRFDIVEGTPVLVDSVIVIGLEQVPERASILANLPTRVGRPFDRYAMSATRDTIAKRLRDAGYPDAEAFRGYETRAEARRATVRFDVLAGPRRTIGRIVVTRSGRDGKEPEVPERAVRRLAGLEEGVLYRERTLERAKRTLYQSEAFAQVDVAPSSAEGDSSLTVNVNVTEGYLRNARIGPGWGTLDCFRATAELNEHNLFHSATKLELRGRVSKIGIGAPLDRAKGQCSPDLKQDPYSAYLNYYGSATLTQASLLRATFVPSLTLYSERRSEYKAFLRETFIGASLGLSRALPRRTHSLGYSIESGRTIASPALYCAVFDTCLIEDQAQLKEKQRLGVVSAASSYQRTDDALDPTRGVTARVEARYASKFTGANAALQFARLSVDGSVYYPIGRDLVIAGRVRVGTVLGPTLSFTDAERFVPTQERFFLGGSTSVRGFRQNELGPSVYIPEAYELTYVHDTAPLNAFNLGDTVYIRSDPASIDDQRAVPTGGNALVVGNLELRIVSPFLADRLRWNIFADVGEVWNRGADARLLRFSTLKVTPGIGVRIRTPIGFLRADLAYNPYDRPSGQAYFDTPANQGSRLYCVSPGNTLPAFGVMVPQPNGDPDRLEMAQTAGVCPGTYLPRPVTNWLRRLTPSIAIGQAF